MAHRAAPLLAREVGVSTLLTRDIDAYVPLDERSARANAFHADLFVSRSAEEIARRPLQKLVSVVSGANKPWPVGTHALGSLAWAARAQRRSKLKLAAVG